VSETAIRLAEAVRAAGVPCSAHGRLLRNTMAHPKGLIRDTGWALSLFSRRAHAAV